MVASRVRGLLGEVGRAKEYLVEIELEPELEVIRQMRLHTHYCVRTGVCSEGLCKHIAAEYGAY